MRVVEHRELHSDPRFHAAFPSVCRVSDSELLVAFRRGRDPRWLAEPGSSTGAFGLSHFDPRSHLVTMRLDARTLEPLGKLMVVPPDPECAEQDPSLLVTAVGEVVLATFGWYPIPSAATPALVPSAVTGGAEAAFAAHLVTYAPWGVSVRRSADSGASFGPHAYLPRAPGARDAFAERRGAYRGATRGAMCERNGTIVLCTYDCLPGDRGARVFASRDGGTEYVYIACIEDPSGRVGLREPALLATPSGALVAFFRSAGADDALFTARSVDDGVTWSPLASHALRGHPFHPLRLSDGGVLLTYGFRHAPFGIRARLLGPEAEDIDHAEEIVVRDDGRGPDLGYPWAVELPDGDVLVVYYWTGANDARVIAASRLTRR